jgi:hypothetical protein
MPLIRSCLLTLAAILQLRSALARPAICGIGFTRPKSHPKTLPCRPIFSRKEPSPKDHLKSSIGANVKPLCCQKNRGQPPSRWRPDLLSHQARAKITFHFIQVIWWSLSAMMILCFFQITEAKARDRLPITTDQKSCAASNRTVYVQYQDWSECITYYVIGRITFTGPLIIFVAGDIPYNQHGQMSEMFQAFSEYVSNAVDAFREEKVPVLILGRPGLFGATGNHEYRHRELEYGLIMRAIEQLAVQFQTTRLALVGHSGGPPSLWVHFLSGHLLAIVLLQGLAHTISHPWPTSITRNRADPLARYRAVNGVTYYFLITKP